MMRALGFTKKDVLVFIILQAFSFAIPGLILGLIIASLLNTTISLGVFYMLQVFGEYGIETGSIVVTCVMMGLVIPLMANIWPARQALSRNLRASLDATNRDGNGEGVSVI